MVEKFVKDTSTNPPHDPQMWLEVAISDRPNKNWIYPPTFEPSSSIFSFSSTFSFSTSNMMYHVYFTLLILLYFNWNLSSFLSVFFIIHFYFFFYMFVYGILSILLLCTIYMNFLIKSSNYENL